MRTVERILLLAVWMSLAGWLFSADVKLSWDSNDPSESITKYTLYEKVGSNYQKIVDVTPVAGTTQTHTLNNVVPGRHVYTCSASNSWGESGQSNEAVTPNLNNPPKNLTWSIVIQVGP